MRILSAVRFGPDDLLDALRTHHASAGPGRRADHGHPGAARGAVGPAPRVLRWRSPAPRRGRSAGGWPRRRSPPIAGLVVLADLALHAHQGVLTTPATSCPACSSSSSIPGHGPARPHEVRGLCFSPCSGRGYDLLLGLRRHRDWTTLRPRAVAAGLDGLRRAYRQVVADVDASVEGERADAGPSTSRTATSSRRWPTPTSCWRSACPGWPGCTPTSACSAICSATARRGGSCPWSTGRRARRANGPRTRRRWRSCSAASSPGGRGAGVDAGVRARAAPAGRGGPRRRPNARAPGGPAADGGRPRAARPRPPRRCPAPAPSRPCSSLGVAPAAGPTTGATRDASGARRRRGLPRGRLRRRCPAIRVRPARRGRVTARAEERRCRAFRR